MLEIMWGGSMHMVTRQMVKLNPLWIRFQDPHFGSYVVSDQALLNRRRLCVFIDDFNLYTDVFHLEKENFAICNLSH